MKKALVDPTKKAIVKQLHDLYHEGNLLSIEGQSPTLGEYTRRKAELLSHKVGAFLMSAMGPDEASIFRGLSKGDDYWAMHAICVGHILGLLTKAEMEMVERPTAIATSAQDLTTVGTVPAINSRKVFVVHGHDNEAKEATARFVERVGLQSIILHEQAGSGRTLIEKFEIYGGDIAFAIVIFTPDDIGAVATEPQNLKARARQNVIMELGYFIGRLGRTRVCALYKGDVELPSDYQGILYIEMDSAGAWKSKLAQEFVQAKLPIELSGLLGG